MCGLGGRGGRKDAAKWACEPHGSVLSELHLPRSTQPHTLPLEAPHCMAFQRITSTFFPFCLLLWLSYLALNFWVYLLRKDVSVAYSLSVLILHSFSLSHSLGDRQAAGKKKITGSVDRHIQIEVRAADCLHGQQITHTHTPCSHRMSFPSFGNNTFFRRWLWNLNEP